MPFDIADLYLPKFEDFIRQPRDSQCLVVDTKNIIAEVLGGFDKATEEISLSDKGEKVLIEGHFSIVLRYKRESNNEYYPTVVLGFDISENNEIIIRHIQGVKQNRVGYRFSASFDSFRYFIELINVNFIKKGIKVILPEVPTNLEGTSYGSQSPQKYAELRKKLEILNASIGK